MMTVITETTVRPGREDDWDRAYHERATDARRQEGWIDLHLLIPVGDPRNRVVVGTWTDRDAWQRWHATEVFRSTREALDEATERHGDDRWFQVAEEVTSTG
jgi:heme-degrading monooxygenase HmoA